MSAAENNDKGPGPSSIHIWAPRKVLNSSILRRLYVRDGLSIRAVAMALGVDKMRVHRGLKKAGIVTRSPGRPRKKRRE